MEKQKESMELISATQLLLCGVALALATSVLRSGRPSLLAFTLIGFILIDSLGVAIAPYLPLSSIEYLNNPTFLINKQDPDLYLRQVLAHWIFLAIACIGLLFEVGRRRPAPVAIRQSPDRLAVWAGILVVIGLLAYARYFFAGPGLDILLKSRISFDSTSDAIAQRSILRYEIENGQGGYMASLAAKIVFPVAVALLTVAQTRLRRWVWFICFALSAAYAFQTREKSPLLAVVVSYTALFLWDRLGKTDWSRINFRSMNRIIIPVILIFFISGAVFYSVNFGLSFDVAVRGLIARTLAIPGATETNFFAVFPDMYDFRGLSNIFKIGLMGVGESDISIYEIAIAATGNGFATNASLLAVAWSGAGYLGVTVISLILTGSLMALDWLLLRLEYKIFLLAAILSIPGFIGLTSGSIIDYTGWGGLISPVLLLFLLTWKGLSRKRQKEMRTYGT